MEKETITLREQKKRRKDDVNYQEQNKHSLMSGDLYKHITSYEEEEAIQRDPEEDMSLYGNTCEEFVKLVNEISDLKRGSTEQAGTQIREKRIQASLLFVTLKKLNRLEKFRTKTSRDTLHRVKQQVDSLHLQLQNLLYEILHLKKEVTKCLQFKSKDEEIELVSVEQFYKEAPESISRPDITQSDTHQLKLARLEWELKQRKQLAALCHELQAEKEKVSAEIQKKQTHLDNLAPVLKEVLNVARPIQDNLGLSEGPSQWQQQKAHLLPHPLYFLYVQADAYSKAIDKTTTVIINGDEEEAQRLKRTVSEPSASDDSDSDNQEESGSKRHHRKKSRLDRQEERKKQLLLAHPLTVTLTMTLKDGNSITLVFSYLVSLHIVTVKPKVKIVEPVNSISASQLISGDEVLKELFPEDYGIGSPNVANYYQLKQVGIDTFDTSQLGLAYIWTQRVAGLNFATATDSSGEVQASSEISQASMPGIMTAIKARLRARYALCQQIQPLEIGMLPAVADIQSYFPQKLLATTSQWISVSWSDYQNLNFTSHIIESHCVKERDIFYKGSISRGSVKLIVAVAVKNCYPTLPPIFTLQLTWGTTSVTAMNNDAVRDIEREVNVYYKELIDKTKTVYYLLTAQIMRLVTCFEILLEASANPDFPRDKVFLQPTRGRNRARPFKYVDIGEGVFTQR